MSHESEVQDRLAGVEVQCTRLEDGQKNMQASLDDLTGLVRRTLYGSNGTPGHQVRLDRLEQRWSMAKWLVPIVLTVVGLALTLLAL